MSRNIFYLKRNTQDLLYALDDDNITAEQYESLMDGLIKNTGDLNFAHAELFKASMEVNARIEARNAQIAKMKELNDVDSIRALRLSEKVKCYMIENGLNQITGDDGLMVRLGRETERVVTDGLLDIDGLPAEIIRRKETVSLDKKAAKELLKSGEKLKGVYIEKNRSIKAG